MANWNVENIGECHVCMLLCFGRLCVREYTGGILNSDKRDQMSNTFSIYVLEKCKRFLVDVFFLCVLLLLSSYKTHWTQKCHKIPQANANGMIKSQMKRTQRDFYFSWESDWMSSFIHSYCTSALSTFQQRFLHFSSHFLHIRLYIYMYIGCACTCVCLFIHLNCSNYFGSDNTLKSR